MNGIHYFFIYDTSKFNWNWFHLRAASIPVVISTRRYLNSIAPSSSLKSERDCEQERKLGLFLKPQPPRADSRLGYAILLRFRISQAGYWLGFVHSKRMESGSVSDFDRLAFGLLVKTSFLPYLIELCLIGNFLLATPLPQAKIAWIAWSNRRSSNGRIILIWNFLVWA